MIQILIIILLVIICAIIVYKNKNEIKGVKIALTNKLVNYYYKLKFQDIISKIDSINLKELKSKVSRFYRDLIDDELKFRKIEEEGEEDKKGQKKKNLRNNIEISASQILENMFRIYHNPHIILGATISLLNDIIILFYVTLILLTTIYAVYRNFIERIIGLHINERVVIYLFTLSIMMMVIFDSPIFILFTIIIFIIMCVLTYLGIFRMVFIIQSIIQIIQGSNTRLPMQIDQQNMNRMRRNRYGYRNLDDFFRIQRVVFNRATITQDLRRNIEVRIRDRLAFQNITGQTIKVEYQSQVTKQNVLNKGSNSRRTANAVATVIQGQPAQGHLTGSQEATVSVNGANPIFHSNFPVFRTVKNDLNINRADMNLSDDFINEFMPVITTDTNLYNVEVNNTRFHTLIFGDKRLPLNENDVVSYRNIAPPLGEPEEFTSVQEKREIVSLKKDNEIGTRVNKVIVKYKKFVIINEGQNFRARPLTATYTIPNEILQRRLQSVRTVVYIPVDIYERLNFNLGPNERLEGVQFDLDENLTSQPDYTIPNYDLSKIELPIEIPKFVKIKKEEPKTHPHPVGALIRAIFNIIIDLIFRNIKTRNRNAFLINVGDNTDRTYKIGTRSWSVNFIMDQKDIQRRFKYDSIYKKNIINHIKKVGMTELVNVKCECGLEANNLCDHVRSLEHQYEPFYSYIHSAYYIEKKKYPCIISANTYRKQEGEYEYNKMMYYNEGMIKVKGNKVITKVRGNGEDEAYEHEHLFIGGRYIYKDEETDFQFLENGRRYYVKIVRKVEFEHNNIVLIAVTQDLEDFGLTVKHTKEEYSLVRIIKKFFKFQTISTEFDAISNPMTIEEAFQDIEESFPFISIPGDSTNYLMYNGLLSRKNIETGKVSTVIMKSGHISLDQIIKVANMIHIYYSRNIKETSDPELYRKLCCESVISGVRRLYSDKDEGYIQKLIAVSYVYYENVYLKHNVYQSYETRFSITFPKEILVYLLRRIYLICTNQRKIVKNSSYWILYGVGKVTTANLRVFDKIYSKALIIYYLIKIIILRNKISKNRKTSNFLIFNSLFLILNIFLSNFLSKLIFKYTPFVTLIILSLTGINIKILVLIVILNKLPLVHSMLPGSDYKFKTQDYETNIIGLIRAHVLMYFQKFSFPFCQTQVDDMEKEAEEKKDESCFEPLIMNADCNAKRYEKFKIIESNNGEKDKIVWFDKDDKKIDEDFINCRVETNMENIKLECETDHYFQNGEVQIVQYGPVLTGADKLNIPRQNCGCIKQQVRSMQRSMRWRASPEESKLLEYYTFMLDHQLPYWYECIDEYFMKEFDANQGISIAEYILHYKNDQLREYLEAYVMYNFYEPIDPNRAESHSKLDELLKAFDEKVRNIVAQTSINKIIMGFACYILQKVFEEHDDGYSCGLNLKDRSVRMTDIVSEFNDPVKIDIDGSSFDNTQHDVIKVIVDVPLFLYIEKKMQDYFNYTVTFEFEERINIYMNLIQSVENKVLKRKDKGYYFKYNISGTVGSGYMSTTVMNTCRNLSYIRFGVSKINKHNRPQACGDDGMLISERKTAEEFKKALLDNVYCKEHETKNLGQIAKYINITEIEQGNFVSTQMIRFKDRIIVVRQLDRIFSGMSFTYKNIGTNLLKLNLKNIELCFSAASDLMNCGGFLEINSVLARLYISAAMIIAKNCKLDRKTLDRFINIAVKLSDYSKSMRVNCGVDEFTDEELDEINKKYRLNIFEEYGIDIDFLVEKIIDMKDKIEKYNNPYMIQTEEMIDKLFELNDYGAKIDDIMQIKFKNEYDFVSRINITKPYFNNASRKNKYRYIKSILSDIVRFKFTSRPEFFKFLKDFNVNTKYYYRYETSELFPLMQESAFEYFNPIRPYKLLYKKFFKFTEVPELDKIIINLYDNSIIFKNMYSHDKEVCLYTIDKMALKYVYDLKEINSRTVYEHKKINYKEDLKNKSYLELLRFWRHHTNPCVNYYIKSVQYSIKSTYSIRRRFNLFYNTLDLVELYMQDGYIDRYMEKLSERRIEYILRSRKF